jgi:ABC-type multidrug transport system ATPase subunit
MLSIEDLSVSYNEHLVLDKLSLLVPDNSKNVIVGQNGSGKTTLMKCLLGLVIPDSGAMHYNGENLGSSGKYVKVSSNLQECYRLLPLNVRDMVSAYSELKNFDRSIVFAHLNKFRLNRISGQKPWNLSTGEQKILFSLMAMVGSPSLVILDEPFENIDFERKELLFSIINAASSEIVLSTHDSGMLELMRGWQLFLLLSGKLIGPLDPTKFQRYYFNSSHHEESAIEWISGNRNFSISIDEGEIPLTNIEKVASMAGRL